MQKRIYIAGKITGEDWGDIMVKFSNAQEYLKEKGYVVINPVTTSHPTIDWHTAMRTCIKQMLDCDAVYMLPCWTKSRGATLERFIAGSVGIEIIEAEKL